MVSVAISISHNGVLTFNGTTNFINNSPEVCSGAISISDNGVLTFNGTNNFINNSADLDGGVISISQNTVYLPSLEPIILSVIQQV